MYFATINSRPRHLIDSRRVGAVVAAVVVVVVVLVSLDLEAS